MTWSVPAGWIFDGASALQSKFLTAAHTLEEPQVIIYDRKPPSLVNGAYGPAGYRIRYIQGFLDADNLPVTQRFIADLSIKWPVGNITAGEFSTALTNFRLAFAAGTTAGTFGGDLFTLHFLPTTVTP